VLLADLRDGVFDLLLRRRMRQGLEDRGTGARARADAEERRGRGGAARAAARRAVVAVVVVPVGADEPRVCLDVSDARALGGVRHEDAVQQVAHLQTDRRMDKKTEQIDS